jgi:hypothetical protein
MNDSEVNDFCVGKNKRRKKPGRPRLQPGERMTVRREISLRPREVRLMDSLAKEVGKSFSMWAREILLTAAEQRVLRQEE